MIKLLREVLQDKDEEFVLIHESSYDELNEESVRVKHKEPSKRLTHLHHLEDLIVLDGHHGFGHALNALQKTHEHLSGKPRKDYQIKTKFDGNSIVWGYDPKKGKFFVGTKAFHSKNPKVNFSDKDVDANHGHAPSLAAKLKFLLKTLPKSTPKQGIYQGDLMYTSPDIIHDDNKLSFSPNTLTYSVDKSSHEGQKIMKSKVGIAPHTSYEDEDGDLKAKYDVDMHNFKDDPDVHYLNTSVRGPHNYTSKDIKEFLKHYTDVQNHQIKMSNDDSHTHIKGHERTLLSYINHTVKNKTVPSVAGYTSWMYKELNKKSDGLDSDKTRDQLRGHLDGEVQKITKSKKHFNNLFGAHKSIADAKNVLVNALSRSSPYEHTILGQKSKPEGYVITTNDTPIKMVDRQHFSAANFDWNEKANPEDNPTVMNWGRFNPVHKGHEKAIKTAERIATKKGAAHKVVASRTHGKNDPLTPSQKLQHLKSMFPGKNISLAGKDRKTFLAQLSHMHHAGVKDLTVVVGGDRAKEFHELINKYNGEGEGKLFNFKKTKVISAGDRDSVKPGTEGASGTKQRQAVKDMDYETFKKGLPTGATDIQGLKMFYDLHKHLQVSKDIHKKKLNIKRK